MIQATAQVKSLDVMSAALELVGKHGKVLRVNRGKFFSFEMSDEKFFEVFKLYSFVGKKEVPTRSSACHLIEAIHIASEPDHFGGPFAEMSEDELIKKHPYMLSNPYVVATIGCGPGWFPILDELLTKLQAALDAGIKSGEVAGWGPCGNCDVDGLIPEGKTAADCQVCEGASYTDDQGRTFRPVQIKEKFGGLRVYLNGETPEMTAAIIEAERKSFETCEQCGAPGKLRRGGWISTLCDICARGRRG
jgi:hypothetical protein